MSQTFRRLYLEGVSSSGVEFIPTGAYFASSLKFSIYNEPFQRLFYINGNYDYCMYDSELDEETVISSDYQIPNFGEGWNNYISTPQRYGTITVTGTPAVNDTITINGVVWTFKEHRENMYEITIDSNTTRQARQIAAMISDDEYHSSKTVRAESYDNVVYIVTLTHSSTTIPLAESSSALTKSGDNISIACSPTVITDSFGNIGYMTHPTSYSITHVACTSGGEYFNVIYDFDTDIAYVCTCKLYMPPFTFKSQMNTNSWSDIYVQMYPSDSESCNLVVIKKSSTNVYNIQIQHLAHSEYDLEEIKTYIHDESVTNRRCNIIIHNGLPYAVYIENETDVYLKLLNPVGYAENDPLLIYAHMEQITALCVRNDCSISVSSVNGTWVQTEYQGSFIFSPYIHGNIDNNNSTVYCEYINTSW